MSRDRRTHNDQKTGTDHCSFRKSGDSRMRKPQLLSCAVQQATRLMFTNPTLHPTILLRNFSPRFDSAINEKFA